MSYKPQFTITAYMLSLVEQVMNRRYPLSLRRRFLTLAGAAALCSVYAPKVRPQRRGGLPDQQIVDESERVATSGRVELYRHGVAVDAALARVVDGALSKMEQMLGRGLDSATLGPVVRVYVSADVTVSHVWRGYDHPGDPRAILFLNPIVARLALTGRNATYAHELAHLLTWRFHSHTLREGLADYLALALHPGAGVGPNFEGYASPPPVPLEMERYLGTTLPPPPRLAGDRPFRRAYYYASYRFVASLIRSRGLATFMELYDDPDPEAAIERLYGKPRRELATLSSHP